MATTRYVSTTGNDGNSGTIGSPYLTINHGITQTVAGDTLFIRGGVYDEIIVSASFNNGSNWTIGSGAIYISGYTGETAIIRPSGDSQQLTIDSKTYIIIDSLTFDGTNGTSNLDNSNVLFNAGHHLRLTNCILENSIWGGFGGSQSSGASSYYEILNNEHITVK